MSDRKCWISAFILYESPQITYIWTWLLFCTSAPHQTPWLDRHQSWGDPINGSELGAGETAYTGVPLNPLFNVNGRAELRLESCLRQARSPRPAPDYHTKRVTIPYNMLSLKLLTLPPTIKRAVMLRRWHLTGFWSLRSYWVYKCVIFLHFVVIVLFCFCNCT